MRVVQCWRVTNQRVLQVVGGYLLKSEMAKPWGILPNELSDKTRRNCINAMATVG